MLLDANLKIGFISYCKFIVTFIVTIVKIVIIVRSLMRLYKYCLLSTATFHCGVCLPKFCNKNDVLLSDLDSIHFLNVTHECEKQFLNFTY